MVRQGRLMHGIGLLRISQTPVSVDTEEYVVFVDGWLAPHGFSSWRDANAYFQTRVQSKIVRAQTRLRSGAPRRPGIRPGARAYNREIKKSEDAVND